jgi:hypothetical protein
MTKWLWAGAVYFAIVFAAAFALGVLRVTLLVPAVGALAATCIELPFTLAISWLACAWIVRRLDAPSVTRAVGLGGVAFMLLMGAEATGAILIFKRSLGAHFGAYATAAGALGLAGQVAFGAFPIVQVVRNRAQSGAH